MSFEVGELVDYVPLYGRLKGRPLFRAVVVLREDNDARYHAGRCHIKVSKLYPDGDIFKVGRTWIVTKESLRRVPALAQLAEIAE